MGVFGIGSALMVRLRQRTNLGKNAVKRIRSSVVCAVLVGILSSGLSARGASFEVTDLRCEYLRDPLGLDVRMPRLSWIIHSDRRDTWQAAYRILVASSSQFLDANEGDLWDSGKIDSDQSIQLEYSGKQLTSRQSCCWKVQVWDNANRKTSWSAPASWTMGLLSPEDWKATWIGPTPSRYEKPDVASAAPILRKTFNLSAPVKRATVYVCGLGYYELYLNGAKIGDHVLDPPVTQYDKR